MATKRDWKFPDLSGAAAAPGRLAGFKAFEEEAKEEAKAQGGGTVDVPVAGLYDSRFQPVSRRKADSERVKTLASTIAQQTLLQPILVRRVPYDAAVHGDRVPGDGGGETVLEIIAGHGRTYAVRHLLRTSPEAEKARWTHIKANVRDGVGELEAATMGAVENLAREDLDPVQQGESILNVKRLGGFKTNAQVAKAMGLPTRKVDRFLQLAEAHPVIRGCVEPGFRKAIKRRDGTTEELFRKFELSLALTVGAYFNASLDVARADLKAAGKAADSATDLAVARVEALLARATRGDWSRDRLEAEIKRLGGSNEPEQRSEGELPDAERDDSSEEGGSPDAASASVSAQAPRARRAYVHRGGQFIVYPQNLDKVAAAELDALEGHLQKFLGQIAQARQAATALPPVAIDDAGAAAKLSHHVSGEPLPSSIATGGNG